MSNANKTQSSIICTVRWMVANDMPDVIHIERRLDVPYWVEEDFISVANKRNSVAIVAEFEKSVVGHAVYELYDETMHVMRLVVDPALWRLGVGSQLMESLKLRLARSRRKEIVFDVRESDLGLQLFLRQCGFQAIKLLRGYYNEDTGEDAYLFSWLR